MRKVVQDAVRNETLPKDSLTKFEHIQGDSFSEFLANANKSSEALLDKSKSLSRGGMLRLGLGTALAIGMATASPFRGVDFGLSLRASSALLKIGTAVGGLGAVVGVSDMVRSRKVKAEGQQIKDIGQQLIHTQSCHNLAE